VRQIDSKEDEGTCFETVKTKIEKLDLDKEPEQWGEIKNPNRMCECGSKMKYKKCC
jgi:hypothetical protein